MLRLYNFILCVLGFNNKVLAFIKANPHEIVSIFRTKVNIESTNYRGSETTQNRMLR